MCGIAGFIGAGTAADLRAMTDAIIHRGPDGDGYFADQHLPVFLGSRRLAVVDIAGGAMPMWDAQGDICVIQNGEIYNHRDLRRELEALGHRFTSDHADTEVLVQGYKAWGEGLFVRLNGMFAVAIYDRHRKRLVLARDRFGEKPLFYGVTGACFAFASELRAILVHPAFKSASASKIGLMKFFAHGFFPGAHTPYDGISKLPAGHLMVIDAATGARDIRAYWTFEIVPDAQPTGSIDDWAEELDQHLGTAIGLRLQADVPVGIFLSGGVDSSAVLSYAADNRKAADLKTFAIGFREASFDESSHAAAVAAHIGATHHLEICDLEAARDQLPAVLDAVGEPIGDSSILPTALLSAFARKHVTVALTGDGGDELFAGYDPFKVLGRAALYDALVPGPVHAAVKAVAARLPVSDQNMSFDFVLNRGLKGLKHPASLWNPLWLAPLQPDDVADVFATPIAAEELYSEAIAAWDACPSTHRVDRVLDFYTRFYLTDGILTKADRASMSVSLEARAPFLDNHVVDFVRRLPWQVKLHGGTTKWILKRALTRRLPANVLARPKKGFGIPLARWLRDWQPPQENVPYLDRAALQQRWEIHRTKKSDERLALWCWMALSRNFKAVRP
jgi:asparagine synthase (glutamine-hydrolysing)